MGKCVSCEEGIAVHFIDYSNIRESVSWSGVYCNGCFVKKLRGMARVWSKK